MIKTINLIFLASIIVNTTYPAGIAGKIAPDLRVEHWMNHTGKPMTKKPKMKDYNNKLLYIYCWQYWCPGCHSQGFPTLKKLLNEFGEDPDIKFLAIQTPFEGRHINTLDKLKITAEKYDLKIPMGHTQTQAGEKIPFLMKDFRTGGTPWGIVIGPDRKVLLNGYKLDYEITVKLIRQFKDRK